MPPNQQPSGGSQSSESVKKARKHRKTRAVSGGDPRSPKSSKKSRKGNPTSPAGPESAAGSAQGHLVDTGVGNGVSNGASNVGARVASPNFGYVTPSTLLQCKSNIRRHTGQSSQHETPDNADTVDTATGANDGASDDEPSSSRSPWAYGPLEENVWDR